MFSLVDYIRYWFKDAIHSFKMFVPRLFGSGFARLLGLSSTTMADFHVQIPYYIASGLLPASLPTISDIESSPDVIGDQQSRCIIFLAPHFVVKCGLMISLMEGQNMLFISQKSDIRVPQIYAMYTNTQTGKNYIVMEYIEGQTLDSIWPVLSSSDKEQITAELKYYIDQLRALPPSRYYGSLGKRHFLNGMFWYPEGPEEPTPQAISGPFDTEEELNEAMILKYLQLANGNKRFANKSLFYRRAFPLIFHGHKPVFTHGDFQRKNIMVNKITTNGVFRKYSSTE